MLDKHVLECLFSPVQESVPLFPWNEDWKNVA
jgi:hypothetical protein